MSIVEPAVVTATGLLASLSGPVIVFIDGHRMPMNGPDAFTVTCDASDLSMSSDDHGHYIEVAGEDPATIQLSTEADPYGDAYRILPLVVLEGADLDAAKTRIVETLAIIAAENDGMVNVEQDIMEVRMVPLDGLVQQDAIVVPAKDASEEPRSLPFSQLLCIDVQILGEVDGLQESAMQLWFADGSMLMPRGGFDWYNALS